MDPREILTGINSVVEFVKSKGYSIEPDYFDDEYQNGIYFNIEKRKLLGIFEIKDTNEIRTVRNHFLIEKGLAYCAVVYNKKIIFFRNFGEGKYFLFSDRTKENIAKLDKLRNIEGNFDIIFQRKDISGIFYEKFKSKRDFLVRNIKNKIEPVEKYLLSQKLFDRIFFIYFLCHKGIITFEDGRSISGANLFKILTDNGNFVENLRNLFHRFNSTENRILCVGTQIIKIPYLNGGLFRPDRLESELEFSLKKQDWKEILDFLNQYHWIIEEDFESAIEDEERVLTPEILGHVYERSVVEWETVGFLKEAEEAAKEKTERKMKGVYYTPEEITSYIAEKTIYQHILDQFDHKFTDFNQLIEKGTLIELEFALDVLAKIKVLDPACGSGAFLIKTSELLFQLKVRLQNKIGKKIEYYTIKLNTITDNVYGVDILEGAVEITKLRLWLWLVSEYREGTEIHSLPNIEYNIRVGNSLIGWTNEKLEQISLKTPLTNEVGGIFLGLIAYSSSSERKIFQKARELLSTFNLNDYIAAYSILYQVYRKTHGLKAENLKGILERIKAAIYSSINPPFLDFLNQKVKPNFRKKRPIKLPVSLKEYKMTLPFHWRIDFGGIVNTGGFDVVIGNPPYGAKLKKFEKDYFEKRYPFCKSNKNSALIFIEKSMELLTKNGSFGMIVPKSLAFSQKWNSGRNLIKSNLSEIVDTSKAFKEVLLEQVIIIFRKGIQPKKYIIHDFSTGNNASIDKKFIDSTDTIILHGNESDFAIFEKMNQSSKYMSSISTTQRGLPYQKFLITKETKYPIIKGRNIARFNFEQSGEYLSSERIDLKNKKVQSLMQPKIISQRIVAHVTRPTDHIIIMSAIDKNGLLSVDTVENTSIIDKTYSLEFLLCLFNSKLISWYAYRYIFSKAIRTMDFDNYYVGKIPLPTNEIKNSEFLEVVNKLLKLQESLKTNCGITKSKRNETIKKINEIDEEIDRMIYKLYGLTEDEQKIIKDPKK